MQSARVFLTLGIHIGNLHGKIDKGNHVYGSCSGKWTMCAHCMYVRLQTADAGGKGDSLGARHEEKWKVSLERRPWTDYFIFVFAFFTVTELKERPGDLWMTVQRSPQSGPGYWPKSQTWSIEYGSTMNCTSRYARVRVPSSWKATSRNCNLQRHRIAWMDIGVCYRAAVDSTRRRHRTQTQPLILEPRAERDPFNVPHFENGSYFKSVIYTLFLRKLRDQGEYFFFILQHKKNYFKRL